MPFYNRPERINKLTFGCKRSGAKQEYEYKFLHGFSKIHFSRKNILCSRIGRTGYHLSQGQTGVK